MKSPSSKVLRCAIYTRKSTEHGLELEFNSLHAQREACEAYIKSQASQGWQALARKYDDPAFSGGNMERPALKRLLADIETGLVDVIMVYKIDRLTRSLADFAKLVEIFDAKSVSFVAVTQQFNTTTSMGRLTLNVLLSFAQFERELSSERVRDKIAASRKRGKWTGGSVPLGYDSVDKKLVINEGEAKTVRMIFSRYLALKSFQALITELDRKSIVTKTRSPDSKIKGGVPFTYGPLAYLLKNRTYLGETGHKGSRFDGEHEPIVDRTTFGRVQELLKANSISRIRKRHNNEALLSGILFDDRGNRMSPSFTVKNGVRYPFYVSAAVLKGRKSEAGSVARISATELEDAVSKELMSIASDAEQPASCLVDQYLHRVTIKPAKIELAFKSKHLATQIPWPSKTKRDLISIDEMGAGPANAPNPQLIQAVVRAHIWIGLLNNGTYQSIEQLSQAVRVHPKIIRSGIRLAFLAPDITATILAGEQPGGLGLNDFKNQIPLDWSAQRQAISVPRRCESNPVC